MDNNRGGSSGTDDGEGDDRERQLKMKAARREAWNDDDVDVRTILKIMMRITDALIKEEIRQRSILT